MDSVKGLVLAAMMLLASATMLVFAMGDFVLMTNLIRQ